MSKILKTRIKPNYITQMYIPEEILQETEKHLRFHGTQGNEGMVFWGGQIRNDNEAWIKSCIHPEQKTSFLSVDIPLDELPKMNVSLNDRREFLFAQIHSHPFEAFHSAIDDNYPITFKPGFFSIVVPFFCKERLENLSRCEIWEYKGFGKWVTLSPDEIENRFIILKGEMKN